MHTDEDPLPATQPSLASTPSLKPQPTIQKRRSLRLKLPKGGLGFKKTVVAEYNKVEPGKRLSTDRLERIKSSGQRSADANVDAAPGPSASAHTGADENENELRLGSDFAMAFQVGVKHEWWIGRVIRLYRKRARSRVLLHRPVSLDMLPKDVLVSASWYGETNKSRRTFKHDSVVDTQLYSLEHYIGSPCLDYDEAARVYRLQDATEQLAALDAAAASTRPASVGSKRTKAEARIAAQKKREREESEWEAKPRRQAAPRGERLAKRAGL